MKRALTGLCLALALTALSAAGSGAPAANLLVNPGFDDAGGSYNGWFTFGSGVQLSTPATDDIALTAPAAAKIYGEFNPGFDVGGCGQAFTMPTIGNTYVFEGWSYVSSADPMIGTDPCASNRLIAKVVFFNAVSGGAELASNEIILGNASTPLDQWIPFSVSAPAPAGALRVEALLLFLQPGTDPGSVFVDDVSFEEVVPPSPAPNLLVNPSFDTDLTGWTTFGNVFFDGRPFALRTPTGSAKLYGPFSTPGDASGLYQMFPASAGSEWELDLYSLHTCVETPITGTNDNFATAKISFFDNVGTEIGAAETTIQDNTSPLGTWTSHRVVGRAPAGTDSVGAYILFVQPTSSDGAIWVDDVSFRQTVITDVPVVASGATDLVLRQNVPNPFAASTAIGFSLARESLVDLGIYDVAGRRVATLLRQPLGAGAHSVTWDGRTAEGGLAAAGVYRYVLRTPTGQVSRNLLLVK